jgi:hypothetical protein
VRWIGVVLVATLSTPSAADPATSKRESAEADKLVAAGEFAKAAIKFRSAYAQDPRPPLLCNAAVAYYRAKDLTRAHYYLGRCLKLRAQLEPSFVDSVTKAIAAVTTRLEAEHYPRIELAPDPDDATATVDGPTSPFDEPVVAGVVWVPAGRYTLTFHAAGHADKSQVVEVKPDQTITENVQLVATTATPPPIDHEPIDHKPIESSPHVPPPAVPSETPAPRSRTPALVTSIATGVVGIAALASYALASHEAGVAGSATTQPDYDAARSSALSYQHASWVLGGVAGASAVVSGVLWYLAVTGPSVEVRATPSGGSVSWGGHF